MLSSSRFVNAFLLLSCLSLVAVITASSYQINSNKRQLNEYIHQVLLNFQQYYENHLSIELETLEQIASIYASDKKVKQLIRSAIQSIASEGGGRGGLKSQNIRDELLREVGANWNNFVEEYDIHELDFYLAPQSTLFLDVDEPDEYGESASEYRQSIAYVNDFKKKVRGFESDKQFIGLRGIVPIFSDADETGKEEYLGIVEAGMTFGPIVSYLEQFSRVQQSQVAIRATVLLDREYLESHLTEQRMSEIQQTNLKVENHYIVASTDNDAARKLVKLPGAGENILVHGVHILDQLPEPMAYISISLQDFQHQLQQQEDGVGHVVIWMNIKDDIEQLNHARMKILQYALWGEIVTIFLIYMALRGLSRHAQNVEQLNLSLHQQIEENSRQQKLLKISEEKFRSIVETASDWVWEVDKDGLYSYNSPSVTSLLGYSPNELLGHSPYELLLEQEHGAMKTFIKSCVQNKHHISSMEHTMLHKNGDKVIMSTSAVPVLSEKHEYLTGYRGSSRDITLKVAAKKLQRDKDMAESANRAKSEFLANMSHELRTPMHGILSFVNMGMKKPERMTVEKTQQYFSYIKTSANRLLTLLNDLLDLSKLEAGKMQLEFGSGSLMQVSLACVSEQQARLKELHKHVEITDDSVDGEGIFDAFRIAQVITNLLSNAIKFSPKGEGIEFSIKRTEIEVGQQAVVAGLSFTCRDYGEGIPQDELGYIFDKFSQSSSTRNNAGGTGLGLAICQEIIHAHHGKIWAKNHPEGGAVFTFVIPQRQD